jgi:hypothetical protein
VGKIRLRLHDFGKLCFKKNARNIESKGFKFFGGQLLCFRKTKKTAKEKKKCFNLELYKKNISFAPVNATVIIKRG